MAKRKKKPTKGQMAILEVLWNKGPATVREVHEVLNAKNAEKEVKYTTTLKFMQVMYAEGLLSRNEEGVRHIYAPLISEQENVKEQLNKIVTNTFKGSATNLVMQLLGNYESTTEELQQIRNFLDELEEEEDHNEE
ncbi:MAG: BlaI/MecI/CopY family transcriptional regulator [Bacteroidota bacterium]